MRLFGALAGDNGLGLAKRGDVLQTAARDTFGGKEGNDGLGTAQTQRLVIGVRADQIDMAVNAEAHFGEFRDPTGLFGQNGGRLRCDRVAVKRKGDGRGHFGAKAARKRDGRIDLPIISKELVMVGPPKPPSSTSAPASILKSDQVSEQAPSAKSAVIAVLMRSFLVMPLLHHIAIGAGKVLPRHFARAARLFARRLAKQEQLFLRWDPDPVGRQRQRVGVTRCGVTMMTSSDCAR